MALACIASIASADSTVGLQDPTRPSGWQAVVSDEDEVIERDSLALRFQGVFSRGDDRTAMISGRHVGIGDEIAGARVIDIENNKVTLVRDGETIELASRVSAIKSSPKSHEVLR